MTIEARIRQQGERSYWVCPNCDRTMGEIVGTRLIVIVRREKTLNFPIVDDLRMTCNRCGAVSAYLRDNGTNEKRRIA